MMVLVEYFVRGLPEKAASRNAESTDGYIGPEALRSRYDMHVSGRSAT